MNKTTIGSFVRGKLCEPSRLDPFGGMCYHSFKLKGYSMKSLKVALAAACAVVVGWAFTASADIPASAYVQDGLIAQWDGIENGGIGQHVDVATAGWTDLVGGCVLEANIPSGASVTTSADSILLSGASLRVYDELGAATAITRVLCAASNTLEIVGMANSLKDTFWFSAQKTASDVSSTRLRPWYTNYSVILNTMGRAGTYVGGFNFGLAVNQRFTCAAVGDKVAIGDKFQFYLDGTLTAEKDMTISDIAATATAGISLNSIAYSSNPTSASNTKPKYHSVRVYSRALTPEELAWNARIDDIRFGSDADRYRFVDGKIQCLMSVSTDFIGAKVSLNDGTPATEVSGWFDEGKPVSVTFIPGKAGRFARWEGLPDGATEDATQTTITIAAGAYALTTGHHTVTWNKVAKSSAGYWCDAENWTCEDGTSRVPQEEDVVVVPGSSTPRATTYLTNSTPKLKSITIGARRTLSVSGWNTRLWAGEIEVQGAGLWYGQDCKGYISCSSYGNTASNRINILTDVLKVNVNAAITASGYTKACGPGWDGLASKSGPGSHGGMGFSTNCRTYDSITEPCMPGTGPSRTTYGGGGGVICITSDTVVVNGSISASGGGEIYGGDAGSGGAVFIKCKTIEGSGTVSANGGGNVASQKLESSPGGGGRVAVHYEPELQSNVVCGVAFRAIGGCDWGWGSTATRYEKVASCGTVYLSDDQLIRCAAPRLGGKIYYGPEVTYFTDIGGEDVDISDCLFEIDTDNFVFAATNSMTLSGTSAREFGVRLTGTNATVLVGEDLVVNGASVRIMNGGNLIVGRDLIHVPAASDVAGGEIYVSANPTNGTEAAACGGTVAVGGDWIVGEHCGVFTCCNADSGSIVKMFAGTFELDNNSYLGGDRTGWGMEKGFGAQTTHANGSNHGGYGGVWSGEKRSGKLYGKKKLPLYPGSGTKGASGNPGLPGGGVVYLKTSGRMTINGKVSVAGTPSVAYTSGTSGGSVFLNCGGKLCGTNGVVSANGGACRSQSANYSAGGGGRTAIWYRTCSDDMAILQEAKGGKRGGEDEPTMKWGEDGTTYWHQIPGLMLFVR